MARIEGRLNVQGAQRATLAADPQMGKAQSLRRIRTGTFYPQRRSCIISYDNSPEGTRP
jgi:hypothetical protein